MQCSISIYTNFGDLTQVPNTPVIPKIMTFEYDVIIRSIIIRIYYIILIAYVKAVNCI